MSDMNGSVGTSMYRISPLRGTDNYNIWRIQMEDILTNLGLYEYTTGTEAFPLYGTTTQTITVPPAKSGNASTTRTETVTDTNMNDEQKKWIKLDWKAISQIQLHVDPHTLTHIQACTTSHKAWELLADTFRVQGTIGLIDL
jgi:hypothetical protein